MRVLLSSFTLLLALHACDNTPKPPPDDGRVTLITDEELLAKDVTPRDEPVPVQPAAALPNAYFAATQLEYTLTLVAEVEPPVIDGVALQATSVAFASSVAVVGYNVAGETQRGAADVFVFEGGTPTLTSRATFTDTDVNAVAAFGDRVVLATATADEASASPAVLEGLTLGSDGVLSLEGHFRTTLSGFAATGVSATADRIYATSGNNGDVFALDAQGTELARAPLADARWLTAAGDGTVVAVRGTPGALVVYDAEDLTVRAEHGFDGASIPESKSTVEVLGGKAFVAGGPTGALVIDLASGLELARIPIPASDTPDPDRVTNAVSVDGELLFISNGAAGVFLVAADRDLSLPEVVGQAAPSFRVMGRLAFEDDGGSVNHITYKDGFLFVATGRGGLKIVRVDARCVPTTEVDGNGIDDDCDGVVDIPVARCDDGIANGDETDVDCGGPDCGTCGQGAKCIDSTDCAIASCIGSLCQPRCTPTPGVLTVCAFRSDGTPLTGVTVDISKDGQPWSRVGTTSDSGRLTTSLLGSLVIQFDYGNARVTRATASYAAGATVEIESVATSIRLVDHGGKSIGDDRATLTYYGNGGTWQYADGARTPWRFGTRGTVQLELLAASGYNFQVAYAGANQTLPLTVVPGGSELRFQTAQVTARVAESNDAPIAGVGLRYHGNQGVWQYLPGETGSKRFLTDAEGRSRFELLPVGGYNFEVSLRGASQTRGVDASKTSELAFVTVPAHVTLRESTGAGVAAPIRYHGNQGVWQYLPSPGNSSQWFTTDALGDLVLELLPVSGYNFEASLRGASQTLGMNAATAPVLAFTTVHTEVRLGDSTGAPIPNVAVRYHGNQGVWQYDPAKTGSTWFSTASDGIVSLELLPVSGYNFEASLRGASQTLGMNAASAPVLTFTTVHTEVRLKDSTGAPIPNVAVRYHGNQGVWQYDPAKAGGTWFSTADDGIVPLELLPVSGYNFEASLRGASQTQGLNAALATQVVFQTVPVTLRAIASTGQPLVGGGFKYYGNQGVWQYDPAETGSKPWVTSSSGEVLLQLLPVTGYTVSFEVNGASQSKSLNATVDSVSAFQTALTTVRVTKAGVATDGVAVNVAGNQGRWVAMPVTAGGGVSAIELLPVPGFQAQASMNNVTRNQSFSVPSGEIQLSF